MSDRKVITISQAADEMQRKINAQRQEIIAAFIAKYKVDPAECIQEFGKTPDGGVTWRVRKMRDDEKTSAAQRVSVWLRRWLYVNIHIDFGFLFIRTNIHSHSQLDRTLRVIGLEMRFIKWKCAFDLYAPEIQRR